MGFNWHTVKFLVDLKQDGIEFGHVATIGRQNLFTSRPKIRQMFENAGIPHAFSESDMRLMGGYSEPILTELGAASVESIDASNYEGATIVSDMNKPIPDTLRERFDTVIDGGTIEHVFDIKLAFENEMSLVKEGGNLIIHTMANNWLGHGFYQFSPELFYRTLAPENGFRIRRIVVHETHEFARWYEVPDPAQIRSRIELSNSWQGVMILVHAQREAVLPLFARTPQQSDYAATWERSEQAAAVVDAAPPALAPASPSIGRRLTDWGKDNLPGLLRLKHRLMARFPAFARAGSARRALKEHRSRSFEAQPDRFRPSR
jgi:hypothetical protein